MENLTLLNQPLEKGNSVLFSQKVKVNEILRNINVYAREIIFFEIQ